MEILPSFEKKKNTVGRRKIQFFLNFFIKTVRGRKIGRKKIFFERVR